MKRIFLINTLMLIALASQAQLAIIYRGNFADGFGMDTVTSFTPSAVAYFQSPYLGDDLDGFGMDTVTSFTPSAVAYFQSPYLGDDLDGFAIGGDKKFTPNYFDLVYYRSMFAGGFADGFAMDSTSYSTPLPVTLLSFEGQALGKKNYLFWKTATEENVSHFALGKGKDGVEFSNIAQVLAKGNSSVEQQYDYHDYHDIAGSKYYRLKIIDNDEQFSYSKVIRLTNEENNFSILLAPNPASDYLSIKFSEGLKTNQTSVKVMSANGQTLLTQSMAKNTVQHNLNLSQLSVGSYFIVLAIGEELFTLPFVKQ